MSNQIKIIADYREIPSKLPEILKNHGANVIRRQLKTGDYIINEEVIIERKTREDFVLSIIQGRLFSQCAKMKKTDKHIMLLIEGNPYHTKHDIDRQAIKGALLSVSLCWQIPIIYSTDVNDSAHTIIMTGNQLLKESYPNFQRTRNSKNLQKKAIYFLQGLPTIGPVLAKALLKKFDTIENVILASEEELMEIEGLGKKKVKLIREFLKLAFTTNKRRNQKAFGR
jgi:DNA excision repair protein ERCC-4